MHAAIIELDALADAVRPAAQDEHFLRIRRLRFAFGRRHPVAFVAAIHIGRLRGELGGAGVDALEHRAHFQRMACLAHFQFVGAGQRGQLLIREAQRFQMLQARRVFRQAVFLHPGLGIGNALQLADEPRVVFRDALNFLDAHTHA